MCGRSQQGHIGRAASGYTHHDEIRRSCTGQLEDGCAGFADGYDRLRAGPGGARPGNRRTSPSRASDSMLLRSSATAPAVTASSNGHSTACIRTSLAPASFASRLAYATARSAAVEKSVAQMIVPKGDRLRRVTFTPLRTVKTGQVASRRTFSATDPSTSRCTPPRPWLPITTRSARLALACARISCTTLPVRVRILTRTSDARLAARTRPRSRSRAALVSWGTPSFSGTRLPRGGAAASMTSSRFSRASCHLARARA